MCMPNSKSARARYWLYSLCHLPYSCRRGGMLSPGRSSPEVSTTNSQTEDCSRRARSLEASACTDITDAFVDSMPLFSTHSPFTKMR